ncbi:unnamed protein product, partial [Ectocarpus sp. 12 AP-2014]
CRRPLPLHPEVQLQRRHERGYSLPAMHGAGPDQRAQRPDQPAQRPASPQHPVLGVGHHHRVRLQLRRYYGACQVNVHDTSWLA